MYAIGISKDVLLVQRSEHRALDVVDNTTDTSTMFLIHRDDFDGHKHVPVIRDEESCAKLIAYLFNADHLDRRSLTTHPRTQQRKVVNKSSEVEAIRI